MLRVSCFIVREEHFVCFRECILAVSRVLFKSGASQTARRIDWAKPDSHDFSRWFFFSESCAPFLPHPACSSPPAQPRGTSHAGGAQSHAGGVAHAGQRLNGLGEVVAEDPAVLSSAPVAAHPGQGGAAHGVVDGLLSRMKRHRQATVRASFVNDKLVLYYIVCIVS